MMAVFCGKFNICSVERGSNNQIIKWQCCVVIVKFFYVLTKQKIIFSEKIN